MCESLKMSSDGQWYQQTLRAVSRLPRHKEILKMVSCTDAMWRAVDAFSLLQILFNSFDLDDIGQIPRVELWFAGLLRENPKSKEMVLLLLKYGTPFRRLERYILSLLKISIDLQVYSCPWESVEMRDESVLQYSILQALMEFDDLDRLIKICPFDDLKSLVVTSTTAFRKGIFMLMLRLASHHTGDFKSCHDLIVPIISISTNIELWNEVIQIAFPAPDVFHRGFC
jgi:hypothetical protein